MKITQQGGDDCKYYHSQVGKKGSWKADDEEVIDEAFFFARNYLV